MLTHVKKLTHAKNFDPRKNIFDPRNPRPRNKYFNPRNRRNPRKSLTNAIHATHVTTQPTQFSKLDSLLSGKDYVLVVLVLSLKKWQKTVQSYTSCFYRKEFWYSHSWKDFLIN